MSDKLALWTWQSPGVPHWHTPWQPALSMLILADPQARYRTNSRHGVSSKRPGRTSLCLCVSTSDPNPGTGPLCVCATLQATQPGILMHQPKSACSVIGRLTPSPHASTQKRLQCNWEACKGWRPTFDLWQCKVICGNMLHTFCCASTSNPNPTSSRGFCNIPASLAILSGSLSHSYCCSLVLSGFLA
eukprot:1160675-Pelagomonas_calceolata.AAC.12